MNVVLKTTTLQECTRASMLGTGRPLGFSRKAKDWGWQRRKKFFQRKKFFKN